MAKKYLVKPFIKWAGGKTQLLTKLLEYTPPNFHTFYEPFLGSGAFFFRLFSEGLIKNAVLADLNGDLINCYRAIRKNPYAVIDKIDELKKERARQDPEKHYYDIRDNMRNNVKAWDKLKSHEKAAIFIYLNKTCFNGLYRENKKGEFNVPVGSYKNIHFYEEDNLVEASKALKSAMLLEPMDFEKVFKVCKPKKNDFVYLDPPYDPINGSATASFTAYTKSSFGKNEQERLAQLFGKLDKANCHAMLSNHNTDYIVSLFNGFKKIKVQANRLISSKSLNRKNISNDNELLVINF
jgi:DNA adenine methylase